MIEDLSGSAAKLLLFLVLNPDTAWDNATLMQGSGVTANKSFYRSKQELNECGFVDFSVKSVALVSKVNLGSVKSELPSVKNARTHLTQPPPPELDYIDEPVSLLSRAAEADRMPSDGDVNQRTSNFQARRRAQIAVLTDTWQKLLTPQYPLQAEMAKQWLHLVGDSAEEVYYVLEELSERQKRTGQEYGVAYVRKVLMSKAQEAAQALAPVATAQPDSGVFELTEPTEEQKKRWRALRQMFIDQGKATAEDFNATATN